MKTLFPALVDGLGPPTCDRMIVGEAPGRTEIAEGKPFIGDCGELLDEALAETSRRDVYVTNAFKGDVGTGNRRPTRRELNDHRPLLADEIERVNPKIILTLGQRAACALNVLPTLASPLHPIAGKLQPVQFEGLTINVLPWFHPGYVLRGGATKEAFHSIVHRFLTCDP